MDDLPNFFNIDEWIFYLVSMSVGQWWFDESFINESSVMNYFYRKYSRESNFKKMLYTWMLVSKINIV